MSGGKFCQPRISVVVAIFNGAKTLQKCLDSVREQTYANTELIIMDGGSTDGTVDLLRKNASIIAYWESAPDRGIYHAWNKALMHATGEWIYFLGADDVLHDRLVLERFATMVIKLEKVPLVAYGRIEYCNGFKRTVMGDDWPAISGRMKCEMRIQHQGVFHHQTLFAQCGNFDERFQIAGDYHLILKSLRYGNPYFLGDFVVTDQYAGGKSSERAMRWKVVNEFREAQKDLEIPWSFCWFWAYAKAQVWRWLL